MTSKPRSSIVSGMSLGDTRSTAQVVSGMKVARAWPWLRCGTWEPVALRLRMASGAVLACGCVEGSASSSRNCKRRSTDVGHRGGLSRSSGDAW